MCVSHFILFHFLLLNTKQLVHGVWNFADFPCNVDQIQLAHLFELNARYSSSMIIILCPPKTGHREKRVCLCLRVNGYIKKMSNVACHSCTPDDLVWQLELFFESLFYLFFLFCLEYISTPRSVRACILMFMKLAHTLARCDTLTALHSIIFVDVSIWIVIIFHIHTLKL